MYLFIYVYIYIYIYMTVSHEASVNLRLGLSFWGRGFMGPWLTSAAFGAGEFFRTWVQGPCSPCPWAVLLLLGIVIFCCGFGLGALSSALVASPLCRRASFGFLRTLIAGYAQPAYSPAPPDNVRRRLGEYRLRGE